MRKQQRYVCEVCRVKHDFANVLSLAKTSLETSSLPFECPFMVACEATFMDDQGTRECTRLSFPRDK